jgi:hypothetical protein
MKANKNVTAVLLPVVFMLMLASCKKEKTQPAADALFSIAVDGYIVNFTNQTTGASSYKWDFGDGATSTEESPVHTYPGKGKFVPTLYATSAGGAVAEASTVIRLAKGSSVKLDDHSFADWDTITHNMTVITTPGGGVFRKVKLDYDGENVYFYIESATTVANADIYDFYFDTDNSSSTGFISDVAAGSGSDVLLEGDMLSGWCDVYYHNGPQNSFAFDLISVNDFYAIGNVEETAGLLKFEGKIVRSKLKGMTGGALKLGMTSSKSDWSVTLGIAPDPGTQALFLDMTQ